MQSIKDFLGCQCHSNNFFEREGRPTKDSTAYTFPWAKTQYVEDRQVLPTHQSLELSVNVDKEELSGTTTIDFKVIKKETDFFKLNSVDLKIHDVQIGTRGNFTPVKFSVEEKHLVVSLPQKLLRGDQSQVRVTYSVTKPKAGMYFIKPDEKYPDRPVQVWTQGQDDDARFWFPCFDEPGIKCTYDVKAEVPSGYIATSNGALHSEQKSGKTWSFHWKTQFNIPAYLVTLTAGKFTEIKDDWRGKPVTYLFEKGLDTQAKVSFGKTPKMLEFFSQKIGVDYPYEKYAQIAASEFIFGGMENTSATTQTDATLHPAEIEEDFTSDDLVAHELAHQWFGDLVTCKSWSHGWLNEGWATFMEFVFKEHDMGKNESDYYRYGDLEIYLAEDAEFRRPIVTNFYADPAEIWDRHTYQKAGLVLQTLKAHLGEEDFWAGTKKYLETHKDGVVETVDFRRAHESVSGENLQQFFDQWIYKTGYPEFKAGFEWDDKTKTAKFKLEQKQKDENIFEVSSEVEFIFKDKSIFKLPVLINEKEQVFYVPLKEKPQYVMFDRGNHILKTMEWALPQEMVKAQLENDTDVVGKVWAMKHLAKEATSEGLEILVGRLKTDSFWGVRAEAALALGETKSVVGQNALLNALKEEKNSKARSKIAYALGNFKDEKVGSALIERLEKDMNIFVKGAAASALGKTKHPQAFDKLKSALKTESWHDYIRGQAFIGLKALHDEKALPLFLEGAKYGAPKYARLNAFAGLSDIGIDNAEVRDFLVTALDDPFVRARYAAAQALVGRKEGKATTALEDAGHRVVDGHFKAVAFRSAERIRRGLKKPEEFHDLRERMDKIVEENRKLQDRLNKLEATKSP